MLTQSGSGDIKIQVNNSHYAYLFRPEYFSGRLKILYTENAQFLLARHYFCLQGIKVSF